MKIGDEVFIHGYVDEIRKDVIIIRNDGGYFGTVAEEIGYCDDYEDLTEEKHAICNGCVYCDLPNAFHPCASCVDFSKYVGEVSGDTPQTDLVEDSPSLVKDLVNAFCEDGTWLERQGVYTLTLAEAKQRAVDIIEAVSRKDTADTPQTESTGSPIGDYRDGVGAWQTDCSWREPND